MKECTGQNELKTMGRVGSMNYAVVFSILFIAVCFVWPLIDYWPLGVIHQKSERASSTVVMNAKQTEGVQNNKIAEENYFVSSLDLLCVKYGFDRPTAIALLSEYYKLTGVIDSNFIMIQIMIDKNAVLNLDQNSASMTVKQAIDSLSKKYSKSSLELAGFITDFQLLNMNAGGKS